MIHVSELKLLFGRNSVAAIEAEFAANFTDAYLNFIHDLNPGRMLAYLLHSRSATSHSDFAAFWPQFTLKTKPVLQWMRDNITVIPDGERWLLVFVQD